MGMREEDATRLVNELYDSLYLSLIRFALRTTGSRSLAEDAVQESFLELYRALREGRRIACPKAWIITVARRTTNRHLRERRRSGGHEPLEAAQSVAMEPGRAAPAFETGEIDRVFSVLSPREEEALLLRLAAFQYREIAETLEISAKTVSALLSRALRKLQMAAEGNFTEDAIASYVEKKLRKTLQ